MTLVGYAPDRIFCTLVPDFYLQSLWCSLDTCNGLLATK
jgi:hypothetical protein